MSTDDTWFDTQVDAFAAIRPDYEIFATHLRGILEQAARSLGVSAIIQVRAKAIPSFAEKILRKKGKYTDPVHQLTDLCGGRVITDTLDQTRLFCRYIRDHFDIDEANSLDVLDRLDAASFGYRSVHFIVSLRPGVFAGIPDRFYETVEAAAEAGSAVPRGPRFKAEIQVRTLLQHAWATVAHDNIYKSAFPIPGRWSREVARVAALLEDADESFSRLLTGISAYASHFGAYMDRGEITREIATLRAVLARDPGNAGIIRRVARLAMAVEEYGLAAELLGPLRDSGDPLAVCDLAEALLGSADAGQVRDGRELLAGLCANGAGPARGYELLAESLRDEAPAEALEHARMAFHAAPSEPRILRGFVGRKILRERSTDFLPLLYPTLDAAIALSRERLALGIALPWTCRDIGLLELFRGRPYAGLEGFALAMSLGGSAREVEDLLKELCALSDAVGEGLPGLEWSLRFVELVRRVRGATGARSCREAMWGECRGGLVPPVVIVAGGCDRKVEHQIAAYRDIFAAAFETFRGTIICGGTRAGISGLVGDLPGVARGDIRLVSHLPRHIPRDVPLHEAYEIRDCGGQGFTPLGAIQGWMDILASGVDPAAVRVVGVNGGAISAAEYMIAAALGAKVGLLRDSGREAHRLLGDPAWAKNPHLLGLPSDAMTVREFVRETPAADFAAPEVETMARMVHENYRREQEKKSVKTDPAMLPWESLAENLKASNRSVAAHDIFKVRSIGLDVRPAADGETGLFAFTPEQIERMAELEHARWNMERLSQGWRPGPRDHAARTTPYLVSWAELADDIRQYDRDSVSRIPERLREVGYVVVPGEGGA